MDSKIKTCNWEIIHYFESPNEYYRFCQWLNEQIKENVVSEVPVEYNTSGAAYIEERWFKCISTDEIWTLAEPASPFRGYWLPLNYEE